MAGEGGGGGGFSFALGMATKALELYAERKIYELEQRNMSTAYRVERRAIEKRRRMAAGSALSDMGASGVEPDLELFSKINYEYELDKSIKKAEYEIERRALKDEKNMALVLGIKSMITSALSSSSSLFQNKQDPLKGVGGVGTSVPKEHGTSYSLSGKTKPPDYNLSLKKPDWYNSMFGM